MTPPVIIPGNGIVGMNPTITGAGGGVPCDAWNKNDAFDMDGDGLYTEADNVVPGDSASVLSTCHGCGIRVASNVLREFGRSGSVWVVVFLSDGQVNLSDTPSTDPLNPDLASYPNGFCTGGMGTGWWTSQCFDTEFAPRHCIDTAAGTCPPGSGLGRHHPKFELQRAGLRPGYDRYRRSDPLFEPE